MVHLDPRDPVSTRLAVPEGTPRIPGPDVPPEVRAFFGETGRWQGTWISPQTKGAYDAALIIEEIYRQEDRWEAKVLYACADFPKWYVEGGTWERTGTFTRRPDGRTLLWVRHPAMGVMEFWFEKRQLLGKLSWRFMLSRIMLKPLP